MDNSEMQLLVIVPEDLKKRLQIFAIENNTTSKAVVIDAIEKYIDSVEKAS